MPPPVSEPAVRNALSSFQDPETGRSAVQLEQIHQVQLRDGKLSVTLGLTTWAAPLWNEIRDELAHAARRAAFPGRQSRSTSRSTTARPSPRANSG